MGHPDLQVGGSRRFREVFSELFGRFLAEGYLVLEAIKCIAWEGAEARGGRMAAKRAIYEPIWCHQRPAKRNKMGQPDLSVGGSLMYVGR